MSVKTLRVATRGSKLALIQTQLAVDAIKAVHPDTHIEIITVDTLGDQTQKNNVPMSQIGGKGIFADALNLAMERGEVDFAVHSYKDLPARRPARYTRAAILKRADVRDCFISNIPDVKSFADLPQGAIVGTSGPRRAAITLAARPDLQIITFRGNVDSRLQKLADGFDGVHATYLAQAGLERMGRYDAAQHHSVPADIMLPAAGQGAIAIEVMSDRTDLVEFFKPVGCMETTHQTLAEKSCVAVINGECGTPLAAYAETTDDKRYRLRAALYTPDGQHCVQGEIAYDGENAFDAGTELGQQLLLKVGQERYDMFHVNCGLDEDYE